MSDSGRPWKWMCQYCDNPHEEGAEFCLKHMTMFEPPFFHIPMPVNENGEGPITDGTEDRIIWEVWDSCNQTVSMHDTEAQAVAAAERYNTPYCGGS